MVLDPFGGSGTTAGVAIANGRNAVLCELSPEYAKLIPARVDSIVSAASKPEKVIRKLVKKSDAQAEVIPQIEMFEVAL